MRSFKIPHQTWAGGPVVCCLDSMVSAGCPMPLRVHELQVEGQSLGIYTCACTSSVHASKSCIHSESLLWPARVRNPPAHIQSPLKKIQLLKSLVEARAICYFHHEIKRHLLLGRNSMTNLDSILKSRDNTLPTNICIVKAMFFPVVMYEYEGWTIKKKADKTFESFGGS